jgi:hypothetical protein
LALRQRGFKDYQSPVRIATTYRIAPLNSSSALESTRYRNPFFSTPAFIFKKSRERFRLKLVFRWPVAAQGDKENNLRGLFLVFQNPIGFTGSNASSSETP